MSKKSKFKDSVTDERIRSEYNNGTCTMCFDFHKNSSLISFSNGSVLQAVGIVSSGEVNINLAKKKEFSIPKVFEKHFQNFLEGCQISN